MVSCHSRHTPARRAATFRGLVAGLDAGARNEACHAEGNPPAAGLTAFFEHYQADLSYAGTMRTDPWWVVASIAGITAGFAIAAGCGSSDETPSAGASGADASADGDAAGGGGQAGSSAAGGKAGAGGSGAQGGSSGAGGSAGGGGTTDQYGPWAGGPTYYSKWPHGPPTDPSFFPIAVWLQDPSKAADYKAIGINLFIGLWEGPTDAQLQALQTAGMPVACEQNDTGLAHVGEATILAWTQQDEPDNAQPLSGGGYGPCVPASEVVSRYQAMKAKDATRPIFLNLGQGVANFDWIGWGSECAQTHPADYAQYIDGADIISFDIYPANDPDPPVHDNLWYVAKGVDNLVQWSAGAKPVWDWIECTGINGPEGKPSPEEVKAEVWMSIVHGAMGFGYFVHQFQPSFDEHALLDDPAMKAAVAALNQQIHDLAPVLNTPPITNGGKIASSDASVPIDMMIKRQGGATYLFAVSMRASAAKATFSELTNVPPSATVEVLGESRTIPMSSASFQDDFTGWGVHLYKIQ